jgi:hypothetical protein
MNLTAVDCMQNAVPKGVEWRNNAKIKEHQLGLTKFPLVCFLVSLCNLRGHDYAFNSKFKCGVLNYIFLHCVAWLTPLSLFLGCTNCTNGCPFRVVEYKPLSVIYIFLNLITTNYPAAGSYYIFILEYP